MNKTENLKNTELDELMRISESVTGGDTGMSLGTVNALVSRKWSRQSILLKPGNDII